MHVESHFNLVRLFSSVGLSFADISIEETHKRRNTQSACLLAYSNWNGVCILIHLLDANGSGVQVKIGDLGLAAIVDKTHMAHTIIGTPEFMAPELYTETYTESVDIYAYGMCVLEMVTREMPYGECESVVQIYKSVTGGVPPAALRRLKDPELRGFIERCVGQPRNRPSATELLQDPFFNGIDDDDTTGTRGRS